MCLVAIAGALGVTPDRLLRAPDGTPVDADTVLEFEYRSRTPVDGLPSMTRDGYEDFVAASSAVLRKVLQGMPAREREGFEAPRRSADEALKHRDEFEEPRRGDSGER